MNNFYKVVARVGHFKKGHYALKAFFVTAIDGKQAAERVRYMPRVKHDNKYAIESVEVITYEAYKMGRELTASDMYFKCKNVQEQRNYGIQEELYVCEGYNPRTKSYASKGDGTRGRMSDYNKKRYVNRYLPRDMDQYEKTYGICC